MNKPFDREMFRKMMGIVRESTDADRAEVFDFWNRKYLEDTGIPFKDETEFEVAC